MATHSKLSLLYSHNYFIPNFFFEIAGCTVSSTVSATLGSGFTNCPSGCFGGHPSMELGTIFTVSVSGYIDSVTSYAYPGDTTSFVGKIWDFNSQQLLCETAPTQFNTGGFFTLPLINCNVTSGVKYIVSFNQNDPAIGYIHYKTDKYFSSALPPTPATTGSVTICGSQQSYQAGTFPGVSRYTLDYYLRGVNFLPGTCRTAFTNFQSRARLVPGSSPAGGLIGFETSSTVAIGYSYYFNPTQDGSQTNGILGGSSGGSVEALDSFTNLAMGATAVGESSMVSANEEKLLLGVEGYFNPFLWVGDSLAIVPEALNLDDQRDRGDINFDDVNHVREGYNGMVWGGFSTVDLSLPQANTQCPGLENGLVSPNNLILSLSGSAYMCLVSGGEFSFLSAYLTSACTPALYLNVSAFDDGVLVTSVVLEISSAEPLYFAPHWEGVDVVTLNATLSNPFGARLVNADLSFVVDNVNVVPSENSQTISRDVSNLRKELSGLKRSFRQLRKDNQQLRNALNQVKKRIK